METIRLRDIPLEVVRSLTVSVPQDAKSYDFFKLYGTNDVIEEIFNERNRYAQQYRAAIQILYREGQW